MVVMATDILVVSRYSVIFKEMNKQTKANTWNTNLGTALRLAFPNDLCNH